MRRKLIVLSIMLCVIAYAIVGYASEEEWTCTNCGNVTTGNYCNNCGTEKPNTEWTCPVCGQKTSGNFCNICGAKKADREDTPSNDMQPELTDIENPVVLADYYPRIYAEPGSEEEEYAAANEIMFIPDQRDYNVTDLQLALLNNAVYSDALDNYEGTGEYISGCEGLTDSRFPLSDSELENELYGYEVLDFDHGDITGFRAAAFRKGNCLILTFCGTEDFGDMVQDFFSGIFDFSAQDGQTRRFAIKNAESFFATDPEIYITGYSMGGRLAYLAAEEICDSKYKSELKRVVTFNGLGVKESFDIHDALLSNIHGLESKFANITANYIVRGDGVSDTEDDNFRSGKLSSYIHVGVEHRYDCTNPNSGDVYSFVRYKVDMQKHDLYTFVDIFSAPQKREYITMGMYEQDGNESNGKEPIEWRVLCSEGNRKLLISRYVLDGDYRQHENYWEEHQESEECMWETCYNRAWLNSTFLNEAFSEEEKKKILITEVVNDDKTISSGGQQYFLSGGKTTYDKIFLLSKDEAEYYFWDINDRICIPTQYAFERGCSTSSGSDGLEEFYFTGSESSPWYLRVPGYEVYENGYRVPWLSDVSEDGSISFWVQGIITYPGIRPVMWINYDADMNKENDYS